MSKFAAIATLKLPKAPKTQYDYSPQRISCLKFQDVRKKSTMCKVLLNAAKILLNFNFNTPFWG